MALFNWLKGEGLAIPFIIKGVNDELTNDSIINVLDEFGVFIRPSIVEDAANYLRDVVRPANEYVKFLQLDSTPNALRIPLSLTEMQRDYSYSMKVQGFSKSTGEIEEKDIYVSTNEILTKRQAMDIAADIATRETKSGGLESAVAEVMGISQNLTGIRFGGPAPSGPSKVI